LLLLLMCVQVYSCEILYDCVLHCVNGFWEDAEFCVKALAYFLIHVLNCCWILSNCLSEQETPISYVNLIYSVWFYHLSHFIVVVVIITETRPLSQFMNIWTLNLSMFVCVKLYPKFLTLSENDWLELYMQRR